MKKILAVFLGTMLMLNLTLLVIAKSHNSDYLKISRNSDHLHSRLSKRYTGYKYKIKNVSEDPIEIQSVSLIDNISGKTAYLSVRRTGIGAATQTIAWGTAFALPTLTLSLIGSVVASPFIIVGNLVGNQGAKMEGNRYDKSLPDNTIMAGETLEFRTLAPHRTRPVLKILFKNPETLEVKEVEYK